MSKITPLFPDQDMTDMTFVKMVHEIAKNSVNVKLTRHAIERMEERSITRGQVVETLKKGFLSEPASKDVHGDWIAPVSYSVAGDRITVIAKLKKKRNQFILVITTY